MKTKNFLLGLAALTLLVTSCDMVIDKQSITSIKIDGPKLSEFYVDTEYDFNVHGYDVSGKMYQGNLDVTWLVLPESSASVTKDGLFKATKSGTVELRVEFVKDNGEIISDTRDIIVVKSGEILTDPEGNYLLDFFTINDFHGTLEESDTEPGINKLATAIKTGKSKNPGGSYILSQGDMWQGSADSNITRGALVTEIMNELDFTHMTLGNHEFDWYDEQIIANKEKADFPFLACNIINKEKTLAAGINVYDDELADPYTIIENDASGVKIGIIGAIGEGITSSILASAVENYAFADPTQLVKDYSIKLREEENCDIVLFSYHNGIGTTNAQIAQWVDAVFIAHDHAEVAGTLSYAGRSVPIIESSSNGKLLGQIRLSVNPNTRQVKSTICQNSAIPSSTKEDPSVKAIYDSYYEQHIKSIKEEVFYETSSNISNQRILSLTLSEMLEKYSKLDPSIIAAVHNSGGVRSNIPRGTVTYGAVYKSLPFDNNLYVVDYKGQTGFAVDEDGKPILDRNGNQIPTGIGYVLSKGTVVYSSGKQVSDLYNATAGYKVVTISYCFEDALGDYKNYVSEMFDDFPREIVASALREGARF